MGLIGEKELQKMKQKSVLVNMGRGGIVDEAALAKALDDGHLLGAALDVFCQEPLPADRPLLSLKNPQRLRLSPHIAWASSQARERLVGQIAANISETFGI